MLLDGLQTPQGAALIGGGMVGLAAALLLVLTGRRMNLSGMLGSLLGGHEGLAATSIAFLAGLVLAPTVWLAWAPLPAGAADGNLPLLLVAGLLAGFAARLGGTGISAQGILGLARLSGQSVAAVAGLLFGGFVGAAAAGWFRSGMVTP
jgi:hypothetical protein